MKKPADDVLCWGISQNSCDHEWEHKTAQMVESPDSENYKSYVVIQLECKKCKLKLLGVK